MASRIVVVAPHPDDEVLGCGGTIARHKAAGDDVTICIVTKTYPPEWDAKEDKMRKTQAVNSATVLGCSRIAFLDYPTVKLDTIPLKDLIMSLENVINTAEIVYCPHRGDVNKDHQIVFDAVMVASRPISSTIKRLYCYECLSETEWGATIFAPNVWVDITSFIDIKVEAIKQYVSELKEAPHPRSIKGIKSLASMRGATIGVQYAEAFYLVREIYTQ